MHDDRSETAHVFDQTNGVVDLGTDEPVKPDDGMTDADRNRIVGGIAMMTVKRP